MKLKDRALMAVERAYYFMDHYRLVKIGETLEKWEKKGYLNALALIIRHPKLYAEVAYSVERHGNVSELHQTQDGIFTVVYSNGHEDYLLTDGRQAFGRRAA